MAFYVQLQVEKYEIKLWVLSVFIFLGKQGYKT